MPNLVTHVAAGWLLSRSVRTAGPWAFLFALGAVIPDISPAIYVPLLDVFRFLVPDPQVLIWYFQPWHTPFAALLFSGAAVCVIGDRPLPVFAAVASGAATHFVLDMFQRHIGMHLLLLYPFHYGKHTPSLIFSDHPFFHVLTLVSLALLLVFFLKYRKDLRPVRFRYSALRIAGALCFLAAVVAMPFLTREAFYKNDYHSLQFFRDPPSREGQPLAICSAQVISDNPWTVTELDRIIRFIPLPEMKVKTGDRLSFEGIYRDGTVRIERWHIHRRFGIKIIVSLMGLVLFALMLIVPAGKGGRNDVSKT